MFHHNIKYTDYNGVERNETFYFNLSKAEIMEMELSTQAGVEEMIRMMIATNDNAKIMQTFKDFILKSYGIKSEDGKRFIKSKELREQFEQSEAYSVFFIDMLNNEGGNIMANNLQTTGLAQLKGVLANETMKKNFENILKENSKSKIQD